MLPRSFSASPRLLGLLLAACCWLTASAPQAAHAAVFTQIATGLNHVCGLRGDQTVYCWGNGRTGQIGVIGVTSARVPRHVIGSYQTVALSSGTGYWCELLADQTASCSGLNTSGQIGDGNTNTAAYPQEVVNLGQVSQISAGTTTSCAVIVGGTVDCWGDDSFGQLGDALLSSTPTAAPQQVPGLSGVTTLDVGNSSVCAVVTSGQVYCWGSTVDGKLGNARTSVLTKADTPVTGLTNARSVAVGDRSACALRKDATVTCWGDNSSGELGNGTSDSTTAPTAVPGLAGVAQISAAGLTTCALKTDGTIWCWGDGRLGQVGGGTKGVFNVPQQVVGIHDAAQVSVGATTVCYVSRSQVPGCWGSNQYGQLGDGGPTGQGQGSASPTFVVDSLKTASFVPALLSGLPTKSTSGGSIVFQTLRLHRTGKYCPEYVHLTVSARGHAVTKLVKPYRINGACSITGRYALPPHTTTATTATYTVKQSGIETRKATLKKAQAT